MKTDYKEKQQELIRKYIVPEVSDVNVIAVMMKVPRHAFIPKQYRKYAYEDHPVSIGFEQTISQPSLVAIMTDKLGLSRKETVLEVGTGSGYQTAILSLLSKKVYTIERIAELANRARSTFKKLHYKNIIVFVKDGSKGLPEKAPFDRIIVTAGAETVPQDLIHQLKKGGRIVIPVGERRSSQMLQMGIKQNRGEIQWKSLFPVAFVPLISF
jgi:protein-L-isoaspartate(D-aspartate) O-methyltransferase